MTAAKTQFVDDAAMAMLESLTLERFLKHTEPRGICLAWTGCSNRNNPQIRLGGGKGQAVGVRRAVYLLTRGPDSIRPGFQIGLHIQCRCELCVHPDHLVARSRSNAQKGSVVPLARKMRIAAAKRAMSRLDIEIVRAIRASEAPAIVLDERYGLSKGSASRIRREERWIDYASPFAGSRLGEAVHAR